MELCKKDLKDVIDKTVKTKKEQALDRLNDILDELPDSFSNFINEAFVHKRVPKEYLFSSILYTSSLAMGKVIYTYELGYKNYANDHFIIIGSRGDGKSQAMSLATKQINDKDEEMYNDYIHAKKNKNKEDDEPVRKRYQSFDATPEALEKNHFFNPRGMGCNYDEMHEIMRQISDPKSPSGQKHKNILLKGYNNILVDVARVTTEDYRMAKSYISLLGGLQKQFIKNLFSGGVLESGLIDRFLFVNLLKDNYKLSEYDMRQETKNEYNDCVNTIIEFSSNNKDSEILVNYTKEAKSRLRNYVQDSLNEQKEAKGHIKEYFAKLQIHIHKIAIQIHILKNSTTSNFRDDIELDTINLAIKINEFYKLNFQIILEELGQPSINKEEIVRLGLQNGAKQKEIAKVIGHNIPSVSKMKTKLGL